MVNANSYTRFAASSSSFRFSRMWMPFTTRRIWCTGELRSLSGLGATSTGQLSEPCFMSVPLVENFVQTFVVERAGHPGELVAELALMRGHAVRVEGLARAPDLEHGEVVRAVGLLHDLEARVAGRGAACLPQNLERDDGVVFLRRDHVDMGHAVDRAGGNFHRTDGERVVEAVVGGRVAQRVELFAKLFPARGRHMGVPGGLVFPSSGDHKLSRPDAAPHHPRAEVSGR